MEIIISEGTLLHSEQNEHQILTPKSIILGVCSWKAGKAAVPFITTAVAYRGQRLLVMEELDGFLCLFRGFENHKGGTDCGTPRNE